MSNVMDMQYKQETDLCHFEPWTYKSWEFICYDIDYPGCCPLLEKGGWGDCFLERLFALYGDSHYACLKCCILPPFHIIFWEYFLRRQFTSLLVDSANSESESCKPSIRPEVLMTSFHKENI